MSTASPTVDQPTKTDERTVRIVLLGCGTIGNALAHCIIKQRNQLRRTTGIDLDIVRVLVRDAQRPRHSCAIAASRFIDDPADVFGEPIDIVVEALGGIEPASSLIAQALERGISVVSANKTAIAANGAQLRTTARQSGTTLRYDAALCAGIPVLAMAEQLAGDDVLEATGILNGTSNYLLTEMERKDVTLETALRHAIDCGLAEPDPTADVNGCDSAAKLCILAHSLGWTTHLPSQVSTSGIQGIKPADLKWVNRFGELHSLRLLATLRRRGRDVDLRVEPAFLPQRHPLASVQGAENGVCLRTAGRGALFLKGEGAGPTPTAAAMLADVCSIASGSASAPMSHCAFSGWSDCACDDAGREMTRFYVRVAGSAHGIRPERITEAFRREGVPLAHIECERSWHRLLTRPVLREQVYAALDSIGGETSDEWLACPIMEE